MAEKTSVFPVIGLEVHAQLQTRSKIFCPCPVTVGAPPNSATCPVCLGFPGTLPVLNREAVTLALRLASAVGAEVHRESLFARKHYFYPDLPKGYQISQYDRPFSTGGKIEIDTPSGPRAIRLVRIHLEEDAGKLLHDTPYAEVPPTETLVDWNRAGVPLVEIVGEPDIRTPEEAAAYLTELRLLLRRNGVSDGDMEKGNLRCDANVSVRLSETAPLGTRVEIKNLNSIRFVAKALEHEIERQAQVIARGERVVLETRLWDAAAGRTVAMRGKEEAHDYRYFPEPDLGALVVDDAWIAEATRDMPEQPRALRARFMSYGVPAREAFTLASSKKLADYFEQLVAQGTNHRDASTWVTGEFLRRMKEQGVSLEDDTEFPLPAKRLGEIVQMYQHSKISLTTAKDLVGDVVVWTADDLGQLVQSRGLRMISDSQGIEALVAEIVSANPSQVALYRSGKTQTFGWFVGQVMKKTGGRADPAQARAALEAALGAPSS
ncbi:MAG: Asp-tRNA(Asn)/Glu-tRNA(Gln) amidotransferase subunit GatB [Acidobacteriota bacterium]